eukprot:COSAG02_NODE_12370_length_1557_cov_1.125514_1_plen_104_part_00
MPEGVHLTLNFTHDLSGINNKIKGLFTIDPTNTTQVQQAKTIINSQNFDSHIQAVSIQEDHTLAAKTTLISPIFIQDPEDFTQDMWIRLMNHLPNRLTHYNPT